ncbi:hypothetical protein ACQCVB_04925 [Fictibacillus phosphorivorans]
MPKTNQSLKLPDPIVMTSHDVNEVLCNFLLLMASHLNVATIIQKWMFEQ